MAGKFGGGLKFGGLAVGQASCQIKFHQIFAQNIESVPKRPGTRRQSVDIVDRSQGERKLVSSGLDYGVTQVFSSSGTHEGPLPHRERTTRSKRWRIGSPRMKRVTPAKVRAERAASWLIALQYS